MKQDLGRGHEKPRQASAPRMAHNGAIKLGSTGALIVPLAVLLAGLGFVGTGCSDAADDADETETSLDAGGSSGEQDSDGGSTHSTSAGSGTGGSSSEEETSASNATSRNASSGTSSGSSGDSGGSGGEQGDTDSSGPSAGSDGGSSGGSGGSIASAQSNGDSSTTADSGSVGGNGGSVSFGGGGGNDTDASGGSAGEATTDAGTTGDPDVPSPVPACPDGQASSCPVEAPLCAKRDGGGTGASNGSGGIYSIWTSYSMCTHFCDDDSDCEFDLGGSAAPTCEPFDGSDPVCLLDCSLGRTCPEGLECYSGLCLREQCTCSGDCEGRTCF